MLFQLAPHMNMPVGLHLIRLMLSSGAESMVRSLLGLILFCGHWYIDEVAADPKELPPNSVIVINSFYLGVEMEVSIYQYLLVKM